jgi:hypothetical protein
MCDAYGYGGFISILHLLGRTMYDVVVRVRLERCKIISLAVEEISLRFYSPTRPGVDV